MSTAYCNIRLATTEAGLLTGWLTFTHQIPEPSIAVYNDHSQKINTSDGGVALQGWSSVQMNFNGLDKNQAYRLRRVVDDALALPAGVLWATIDLSWNGSAAPHSWVDVFGIPAVPDISPSGDTRGALRETITLTINNITIDNNPATGI